MGNRVKVFVNFALVVVYGLLGILTARVAIKLFLSADYTSSSIYIFLFLSCILSFCSSFEDLRQAYQKKYKPKNNSIYIRYFSAEICDLFEDVLDKYDLSIPSDDRTGDECEARIFGEPYFELEDLVTEILINLFNEIKENPEYEINYEEY